MPKTLDSPADTAVVDAVTCPHCKKQFAPTVDRSQAPRLQGAKCPNCKLFVPERLVRAPLTREERQRRG